MKRAMLMNKTDSVATALESLNENDIANVLLPSQEIFAEIIVKHPVPFGHKFAVKAIGRGDAVIKYGEIIGQASADIGLGEYVHIHNVKSNRMQLPEIWYREQEE